MMKRRGYYGAVGTALAAFGCTLSHAHAARVRSDRVVSASAAICRKIAPDEAAIQMSVTMAGRSPREYCCVQCETATGRCIATLIWHAATGRVYEIACPRSQYGRHPHPMNTIRTVRSARYWLRALYLVPDPDAWRPVSVLQLNSLATVTLGSQGKYMSVCVDKATGDLVSVASENKLPARRLALKVKGATVLAVAGR